VDYRQASNRAGSLEPGRSSRTVSTVVQRQGVDGPGKQTLTEQLPIAAAAATAAHATISLGATGPDAVLAQTQLNEHGASPPLVADGQFGARTRSAAIAFQGAHGLTADGIIGPRTWAALDPAGSQSSGGGPGPAPAPRASAGSTAGPATATAAASLVPAGLVPATTAASAVPGAAATNPAPTGAPDAWLKALPRLEATNHASNPRDKGLATVANDPGHAPTMHYNLNQSQQVGGGGDQVATKAAVQAVLTARGQFPVRNLTRSPFTKGGNFYDPDRDKSGAAAGFEAGRNTARPSVSFKPGDVVDEQKWHIFTRLWSLEGNPGIVTTSDDTLTIGVGFSSAGGMAELVLGYALDHLPEIKAAAVAGGLMVNGRILDIVDTEKKVIVSGDAAAAYAQTVPELLSFMANIAIGAQTDSGGKAPQKDTAAQQRQMMLDAQWVAILGAALNGIPGEILGWDLSSATLAVHARHALQATFPWSVFQGANPGTENVIRTIFRRLARQGQPRAFPAIVNGEFGALGKKVEADEKQHAKDEELRKEAEKAAALGLAWSVEHMYDEPHSHDDNDS
jgi:peptidoglycan hydrolase-like protein with peptidoglycan-binding domain